MIGCAVVCSDTILRPYDVPVPRLWKAAISSYDPWSWTSRRWSEHLWCEVLFVAHDTGWEELLSLWLCWLSCGILAHVLGDVHVQQGNILYQDTSAHV
mgnify:CR=1 FL=1